MLIITDDDGAEAIRIPKRLMQVIDSGHDHPLPIVHLEKVVLAMLCHFVLDVTLDILALILMQLLPDIQIECRPGPNCKLKVAKKLPN